MAYDWMDEAVCREVDPDLWFPEKAVIQESQRARAICNTCPVQAECLDYALSNGHVYGIWGGFTERQRRTMRRRQMNYREAC